MLTHITGWLAAGVVSASLAAPVQASESDAEALAAITQRSYGSNDMSDIVRRSTAGMQSTAPRRRIALPLDTPSAPTAHGQVIRRLDEVRLERTDRYRRLIEHHSAINHVDATLVQAIVYTESGGDALAESPAGAQGLMQLMPATARALGVTNPLNPEQSLQHGIRHLRDLLDQYGSTELALWAYNAGPGAVRRGVLPAETAGYVPQVLAVRQALVQRQGIAR